MATAGDDVAEKFGNFDKIFMVLIMDRGYRRSYSRRLQIKTVCERSQQGHIPKKPDLVLTSGNIAMSMQPNIRFYCGVR